MNENEIELKIDNHETRLQKLEATLYRIEQIITSWNVRLSDSQYLNCPRHIQTLNSFEKDLNRFEKDIDAIKTTIEDLKDFRRKVIVWGSVALLFVQFIITPIINKGLNHFIDGIKPNPSITATK